MKNVEKGMWKGGLQTPSNIFMCYYNTYSVYGFYYRMLFGILANEQYYQVFSKLASNDKYGKTR